MKKRLIILWGMILCSLGAVDYFSPSSEKLPNLKSDAIYPVGRIFPFGGFAPADVKQIKLDGFTFAGPAYSLWQQSKLDDGSKNHNMPQIFAIHLQLNGSRFSKNHLDNMKEEDFKNLQQQVEAQIKDKAANKNIAWWYVTPEELRPWRKNDMRFFNETCKTIRHNDPLKRPIWIYLPNHYSANSILPFAKENEIIGKGMYPIQLGKENQRVWNVWSTLAQVEAIEKSENNKAIAICVPELYKEASKNAPELETRVRYDVWSSLLNGSKGVVVFSLAKRANLPSYNRYYKAYSTLAKELTGELALGDVILFGKKLSDTNFKQVSGPKELKVDVGINNKVDLKTYPTLIASEYAWNAKRYIFCANSSPDNNISVELDNLPKEGLQLVDVVANKAVATSNNGKVQFNLKPYEVKLMIIKRFK